MLQQTEVWHLRARVEMFSESLTSVADSLAVEIRRARSESLVEWVEDYLVVNPDTGVHHRFVDATSVVTACGWNPGAMSTTTRSLLVWHKPICVKCLPCERALAKAKFAERATRIGADSGNRSVGSAG